MKYRVPDMSCGHCKASIEAAITGLDSAASVTVDLASKTVEVQSTRSSDQIVSTLEQIGFAAKPLPT